MESGLYEGTVDHERLHPVKHRFQYGLSMTLIDLAELPGLYRARLLTQSRFSPRCFQRQDHFGDHRMSLEDSVREVVRREADLELDGPIRLLTQLRMFGYYFSPLNLFFCFDAAGRQLRAIVAEVQNTPWLERHCYVLSHANAHGTGAGLEYRHPKAFHVSPFMGMDMEYRWTLSEPGHDLRVKIENVRNGESLFSASMRLKRVEWTRRTQFKNFCRYPFTTARITAAIYRQAWSLWRKKCPFFPHPNRRAESSRHPETVDRA